MTYYMEDTIFESFPSTKLRDNIWEYFLGEYFEAFENNIKYEVVRKINYESIW